MANKSSSSRVHSLSLHYALPISRLRSVPWRRSPNAARPLIVALYLSRSRRPTSTLTGSSVAVWANARSEEHTSELHSQFHLVCRILLDREKKIALGSLP